MKKRLELKQPVALYRLVQGQKICIEPLDIETVESSRMCDPTLQAVILGEEYQLALVIEDDGGDTFHILVEDLGLEFMEPVAAWKEEYYRAKHGPFPIFCLEAKNLLELQEATINGLLVPYLKTPKPSLGVILGGKV